MADENLDAANLAAVLRGGIINESVLQQIFDVSNIPLVFTDRISSMGTKNQQHEWTVDRLQDVDVDNAVVDGSDAEGDDSNTGLRVANRHQILTKQLAVSTRARNVDTIGFSDTLAYQVMMRNREIRRDLEAISLQPQASVVDDGSSVPGRLGGFPSWLTSTYDAGVGGSSGGFNTGTGLVDAPTEGEARGLTETLLRDTAQAVWELGGNPTIAMSTPAVIRQLSSYMFTDSARIATLQRNEQGMAAGTALGSVNVLITDFGVTLELLPNRLQQTYDSADIGPIQVANVFVWDTEFVSHGFLNGFQVDPIAKIGLSDRRQLSVDATLVVQNEEAHGVIADIDGTVPVLT